jgi:hypothetical protein
MCNGVTGVAHITGVNMRVRQSKGGASLFPPALFQSSPLPKISLETISVYPSKNLFFQPGIRDLVTGYDA